MSLALVTAAAAAALDYETEAKVHLRVDSDDEKGLLANGLIPAATEWCEGFTNRALITQTWRKYLDHFPSYCFSGCRTCYGFGGLDSFDLARYDRMVLLYGANFSTQRPIEIPKPPLQAVTSIKYYDPDGVQQTWSPATGYEIDPPIAVPPLPAVDCQPYRLWPRVGQSYPATQARRNAVEIEFVCGYGAASANVPGKLRQAMLLMLGEFYERREQMVSGVMSKAYITAERLAWPYRVNLLGAAA